LLFDIDGTLVSTGGAGRRAMTSAFMKLYGKDNVFEGMTFAGMTDRAIARHGLGAAGSPTSDDEIERMLDTYLELLHAELEKAASYRVLPGVMALLESLAPLPGFAIGLGTGNVKRGAYAKLTRGAIAEAFSFGGFGCDAEDRVELLRAGAKRGADALGVSVDACRVVVIGDTPKDVAAAKGIGAPCIGVGTGGYAPADLMACGAHRTFANLEDDGVLAVLRDGV
jgi:phosphoglycolate phosphatase